MSCDCWPCLGWCNCWICRNCKCARCAAEPSTVIPKGDARDINARLLREAQANPEAST